MKRWTVPVALLLTLAAGCGNDTTTGSSATTEHVTIPLTVRTSNGLVAQNTGGDTCEWGTVHYDIVDTSTGATVAQGTLPDTGQVVSVEPTYDCELVTDVDAPVADFYELTVEGTDQQGRPWDAHQTFSHDQADTGITLTA
jgi:hypothetical protein